MAFNQGVNTSAYTRTYTSFAGCDIVATFQNRPIGELQTVTYSISREKAPIYTLGSADPRSFSRGKRGLAGSLVFTVFDRDAMIEELREHAEKSLFQRVGGDVSQQPLSVDEWDSAMRSISDVSSVLSSASAGNSSDDLTNAYAQSATINYADEIPPFDITISAVNEYGQKAALVLFGVEILNEGSSFSIDNVVTEKACTFVARRIKYLHKVE